MGWVTPTCFSLTMFPGTQSTGIEDPLLAKSAGILAAFQKINSISGAKPLVVSLANSGFKISSVLSIMNIWGIRAWYGYSGIDYKLCI